MPTADLLYDAQLFTVTGLGLALLTVWLRRDLRAGMATLAVVIVTGLAGLHALDRYGASLADATLAVVLRETLLLLVAIGFSSIVITFVFKGVFKRLAIPRILGDVLIVLVLVVFGLYRMKASGVNLASIITTSAIITTGIAFSLREPLENLWGGIALQLDNTCRIGDWIRMDNVTGQVINIRWRCTSVATNTGETVIIPNAQLIKARIVVLARRGDERIPWRRFVEFSVAYNTPPSRVIAAVTAALARAEIRNVAADPHTAVMCTTFGDSGIHYSVRYGLTDLGHDLWTDSQIRLHIAATLARHGMEIPFPHRVLVQGAATDAREAQERELAARSDVLSRIELFKPLTDPERRALAAELGRCPFVTDDVITRQGEAADSLYVLAQGSVAVYDDSTGGTGARDRLATLEAPSCFGEMGLLTGQARGATIIALSEVLCYRLDKAGFDAILKARPVLVEPMSQVVIARQTANAATLQALGAEVKARQSSSAELVRRIRKFFAIES